ncbi:MAG TPA: hypothetical protein VEK33_03630 [Terriglobales bacterium]|nr:hypothetical protein [Terriglobales bacterium]
MQLSYLAAGGLGTGTKRGRVYLKMLNRSSLAKVGPSECDFYRRTLEEESARLRELMQPMQRAVFLEWMKNQDSLCLEQAHKLAQHGAPGNAACHPCDRRAHSQLQQELGAFLEQAVQGTHAGAGILGGAAEFLVSQRGL